MVDSNALVLSALVVCLWAALGFYGFSALWWLVETFVLSRGWRADDETAWGLDDVQVRVLTVDAEDVVQGTVNTIPDGVADVRVVAEAPVDIDGADVHVVPDAFECDATNKGRAVEWARRNVPCDTEYVLYLDEDTLVTGFDGLPDADFVQFTEKPIYTGSRLAYLCEVFRVGYQFEQTGLHRLSYPLYAWGGGFAVRRRLEEEVTWDVPTITEDTNFIWRAADRFDGDYRLVDARFRNQAPPSLRALVKQRRRWMSGTIRDDDLLPVWSRPLYFTRVVARAFSPLVPVLVVYMFGGVLAYKKHPVLWSVFLLLTPVAVVRHAAGAVWGVVSPVETFEVTEKVAPDIVEDVNAGLEHDDIARHDGTDRLVRQHADAYDIHVFDD